MSRAGNRAALSAALALVAAAGVWISLSSPAGFDGSAMPCPVRRTTGWYCPGCGGRRCAAALLHLDFVEAVRRNLLVAAAVPWLAVILARGWWRWLRGMPPRHARRSWSFRLSVIAAILVAFAVLRNLPWPPFTWLAPD